MAGSKKEGKASRETGPSQDLRAVTGSCDRTLASAHNTTGRPGLCEPENAGSVLQTAAAGAPLGVGSELWLFPLRCKYAPLQHPAW